MSDSFSKESQLHKALAKWFKELGIPFLTSSFAKRATINPGWPDFTLCLNGRCLFIEAKVGKNKTTPIQDECHAALRKAGNTVHVVTDAAITIELVRAWMGQNEPEAPSRASSRKDELLFVADFFGKPTVFRTEANGVQRVRSASAEDMRNLPAGKL